MKDILVRDYNEHDWTGWLDVINQSEFFDPHIDCKKVMQEIHVAPGHVALVAEVGDKIVGIAAIEIVGQWAHLWRIGVLPVYQNQKIGTMMLSKVEEYVFQQGCKTLQLLAQRNMVPWYETNGFEEQHQVVLLTKGE